jgi:hypothetical protein
VVAVSSAFGCHDSVTAESLPAPYDKQKVKLSDLVKYKLTTSNRQQTTFITHPFNFPPCADDDDPASGLDMVGRNDLDPGEPMDSFGGNTASSPSGSAWDARAERCASCACNASSRSCMTVVIVSVPPYFTRGCLNGESPGAVAPTAS